jgi:hypothetical protein
MHVVGLEERRTRWINMDMIDVSIQDKLLSAYREIVIRNTEHVGLYLVSNGFSNPIDLLQSCSYSQTGHGGV